MPLHISRTVSDQETPARRYLVAGMSTERQAEQGCRDDSRWRVGWDVWVSRGFQRKPKSNGAMAGRDKGSVHFGTVMEGSRGWNKRRKQHLGQEGVEGRPW